MADKKLTDKQRVFCQEYIRDWNGTRAAIAAGYSENSAKEIASENLTKPNIAAYIEEIQQDIAKQAGLSKLGVLEELKTILEEDNPEKVTAANKLKALEIINKMLSFNDPEKKDITSGGKSISPIDWAE